MLISKITCDSCHAHVPEVSTILLSSVEITRHFCDYNCVESWLQTRFRQKQGNRLVITTIADETIKGASSDH